MRFFAIAVAFVSVLCFSNTAKAESKQYIKITSGFTNVYEELDPTSPIVKQAKKGDHFELVFAGTSWYKIKVKDTEGWVEIRSAEIVNDPDRFPILSLLLVLVLIGGTASIVSYYIYKNRLANA